MKPYFETELGSLYHGDCLELELKEKPALICIDPPYNIKKDAWDTIDGYEAWMGAVFKLCERTLADNGSFYWFHNKMPVIARFMEWLRLNTALIFKQLITWNKYFEEAHNVGFCKQRLCIDGSRNYYGGFTEYCLFYTFQDETGLEAIYKDHSNFSAIKEYLKLEKKKSKLSNKDFNLLFSEFFNKKGCRDRSVIEHYWSNNQWVFPTEEIYNYILQATGYFQRPYEDLRKEYEDLRKEYEDLRKEYEDLRKEYEDLRYTFNVQPVTGDFSFQYQDWNNNVWNYSAAPQIGHLTPKPVRLIENIIKHSSNEGDLCADFFGGSGTFGLACENLNRRWIMCEKEERYCEISAKRIESAASQMKF